MLAAVGAGRLLAGQGGLAGEIGIAVQGAAVHGGFIAQGLVIALDGRGAWLPAALRVTTALLGGFVLARLSPWGGLALLAVPVVLLRECRELPVPARAGVLAYFAEFTSQAGTVPDHRDPPRPALNRPYPPAGM